MYSVCISVFLRSCICFTAIYPFHISFTPSRQLLILRKFSFSKQGSHRSCLFLFFFFFFFFIFGLSFFASRVFVCIYIIIFYLGILFMLFVLPVLV